MSAFARGFVYAFRGIGICLRRERNFRVHTAVAGYVLLLAPHFLVSRGEWALLALTIGLVMAAEAVNTAIENAVDLVGKRCETARVAKDVAAGAVLLCALAAIGVGAALFVRADGFVRLGQDFAAHIWKPIGLAASLPVAGFLVFRSYEPSDKKISK